MPSRICNAVALISLLIFDISSSCIQTSYNLFLTSFHIWPISSDNMPFELKDFQLYGGLVHAVNIIRRKLLFVWMFSLGPSILFLFIDFQIMVFKVKFIFSMDLALCDKLRSKVQGVQFQIERMAWWNILRYT